MEGWMDCIPPIYPNGIFLATKMDGGMGILGG